MLVFRRIRELPEAHGSPRSPGLPPLQLRAVAIDFVGKRLPAGGGIQVLLLNAKRCGRPGRTSFIGCVLPVAQSITH